jgi:hypothetical protein
MFGWNTAWLSAVTPHQHPVSVSLTDIFPTSSASGDAGSVPLAQERAPALPGRKSAGSGDPA